MSRIAYLLNALNNGGDIKDFEPQSRCEEILKACCTGDECCVEPQSRIEALLKVLHGKMCDGGGGGGGSTEEEWFNDGNTHIWISLPEGRTSPMLGVGVDGTVTVDWGDGTTPDVLTGTNANTAVFTPNHHYASAGDYVITLSTNDTIEICAYNTLLSHTSATDDRNRVYQNAIKKVEMSDNVTSIGMQAFSNCYSLASIHIPNSVTSIAMGMFMNCYSLASIHIPNSVTSIGAGAFSNCYSLASVHISNSVTSIDKLFSKCYSLASVHIPNSVTSIGTQTFLNCYSLGKIRFEGATPPTLASSDVFASAPADCIISVPVGCLEAYKSATNYPNPNTYTYIEE